MNSNTFVLAIDQGTTSCRAILFDHDGGIVSIKQREITQRYPRPGWVEHDAEEIWNQQSHVIEEVMEDVGLLPEQIAAIGITNQRETIVAWNKETGKPICKAIVWQDRRTSSVCRDLKDKGKEDLFRTKTGLLLDPYFSGTKINWILENVEGARDLADDNKLLFGTIDSWLIWKLTDGERHITDVTNASRTLVFNIHSLEWDDELLELLEVPANTLPTVCSCSEVYGKVTALDCLKGSLISGIAGDQHAALFGQLCLEKGMAKNTYGTGCFLLMNTGENAIESKNNLLTTLAWKIGDKVNYALEGSVFIGGAVVQWLRDELEIVKSAEECNRLAGSVEDSNGAVLVPAFTGLGAPHWDPYARGAFVGITRGVKKAHLCRAALESIGLQSADVLEAMEKDSGINLKALHVDGGASQSELLLQFQSDLLQRPVDRPKCVETTASGTAYLAGLATGFWESVDELKNMNQTDRTFLPQKSAESMQEIKLNWRKAIERCKSWE